MAFLLLLLRGNLCNVCFSCYDFRSCWKEKQAKQKQVWTYWIYLIPDIYCYLLLFLLCSSYLFFSGDLWRYWIVPCSRIMLWCRDMPGSNNNEQVRPILLKSKIQVRMCITRDLILLSLMWQWVANNYFCFLFWRIFHMAAFQSSICDFLTKAKLRNSLKLHYYLIK